MMVTFYETNHSYWIETEMRARVQSTETIKEYIPSSAQSKYQIFTAENSLPFSISYAND